MTRGRRIAAVVGLLAGLSCAGGCSEPAATPPVREAAARPALGPAFQSAMTAGIRVREGDGVVEVDSFLASVALEALLAGESGLTLEPRVDAGGETQGYRIRGVTADSIFGRVGLRDGDVVGAINGVGLTSPGRALGALQGARRQIVIGLERGDGALLLEVHLVDGLAWAQTLATQGAAPERPPAAIVDASSLVAAVDDDALAAVGEPPPVPVQPVPKASKGGAAPSGPAKPIPTSKGGSAGGSKSTGGSSGSSGSNSSSGSSGSSATAGSLCTRPDTCTVRRSEFNAALADPESASDQANFVGTSRGYNLYSIKRGSTIARLGFQNGDLIKTINGYRIADTGEAMALYLSLNGTSTYRVVYERAGKSLTKTIKVV
ncbi:MAG: hypothetical protein R3B09_12200 [Nannocystaceae bacterium]